MSRVCGIAGLPLFRFAALLLVALRPRIALGAFCDVGDAIQAIYDGDGSFRNATIAHIDLQASPSVEVTVDWDDASPSFRVVALADTRSEGVACSTVADTAQTFSAEAGFAFVLTVTGAALTDAARVLIAGVGEECGSPSATQDPAVSSPPGTPLGTSDLMFFDVVVGIVGSYEVCFWSGQSVEGLGANDVASYATQLGPLTITATTTTTTTTTTTLVSYSRRRGAIHSSSELTVRGSKGILYDGLTVVPAAWNLHLPSGERKTCRQCQAYRRSDVSGDFRPKARNALFGQLVPERNEGGTTDPLGLGCATESPTGPIAAPGLEMVLMVSRGFCSFEEKAIEAYRRGFSGILVVDLLPEGARLSDMAGVGGAESEAELPVPAWLLPSTEGEDVRLLLEADPLVSVTVEDVSRKARLADGLSDGDGARSYAVK